MKRGIFLRSAARLALGRREHKKRAAARKPRLRWDVKASYPAGESLNDSTGGMSGSTLSDAEGTSAVVSSGS